MSLVMSKVMSITSLWEQLIEALLDNILIQNLTIYNHFGLALLEFVEKFIIKKLPKTAKCLVSEIGNFAGKN